MLWSRLRNRQLEGLKFRRQHPFEPYVLDFYCPEAKLCVEIDGWGHNMGDSPERDRRRDAFLASKGVDTLRISAKDVMEDTDEVMWAILGAARR